MRAICSVVLCAAAMAQDPTPPAAPAATPAPGAAAAAVKPAPIPQATAKLQKVLAATAALPNCAFATHWGLPKGAAQPQGPMGMLAQQASGSSEGVWHDDLLHLVFGNDDELLVRGRSAIAKDGTRGWSPRRQRFADGNAMPFVPDPQRLLLLLQSLDLQVVHREVTSLADRPVEIASVELTQDQYTDLLWSGLVPEVGVTSMKMFFGAMLANQGRAAAAKPEAIVDVAFTFDPSTNLLQRIHLRTHNEGDANRMFVANGGARIQIVGGAVIAGGGNAQAEDEKDDEDKSKDDGPPTWENGLPVRRSKKTIVSDFELDLTQHGTAAAPELDDTAKKLLGR